MHRGGRFGHFLGGGRGGRGHQSEDGLLMPDPLSPLAESPRLARGTSIAAAERRSRTGNVRVEAILSPERQCRILLQSEKHEPITSNGDTNTGVQFNRHLEGLS